LTVASLMNRRLAASRFEQPRAIRASTSSSRWLSGSLAGALTWPSNRVATDGESTASPRAAARTPRRSSSGGESFSR
jgi:hypothetical protein